MSTKRQKFLKKLIIKILLLMVIPLSIIFTFVSIYWWTKKLDVINNEFHKTFNKVSYQISSFDYSFDSQNKITQRIPKKTYITEKKEEEVFPEQMQETFDTVYYNFLFNQMIIDYGMADIDSNTIDSLVKIEMKNRLKVESTDTAISNIEEQTQTIKKDELIHVKSLKPVFSGGNNISYEDSLSIENKTTITYTIEFWKTPLKTQGIKSVGNLIIIYGIEDFDSTSLKIDNKQRLLFVSKNLTYLIKFDGKLYSFRELQLK